jgi:hypothetical protein
MQVIPVAPFCGVINAFLESPLKVRHGLGATSKPHLRAEVISTSLARSTVVARNTNLQRDSVTDLEAGSSIPHSYNHPSGLMAQRERLTSVEIAIAELAIV